MGGHRLVGEHWLVSERDERWREGEELSGRAERWGEWEKLRKWGGESVGQEWEGEENVKCFTNFLSVKYLTFFAFGFSFDWKYFTFDQLF